MSVQPKLPADAKPVYKGEVQATTSGNKFAKPFEETDGGILNMGGLHNDIGEQSGFEATTDAYIVKKGTPYGEAAKFNIMPPGMDINDQPYRDIREMSLKKVIAESYPGDGWEPSPRDLSEGYGPKGTIA